jgi:hypothetical protein
MYHFLCPMHVTCPNYPILIDLFILMNVKKEKIVKLIIMQILPQSPRSFSLRSKIPY